MNHELVRRPPHFVPTLTEVVQGFRPTVASEVSPSPPLSAALSTEDDLQKLTDTISDRVLSVLQPRLQQAVTEGLQQLMAAEAGRLGERVAHSLLDEMAEACRQAAEEALRLQSTSTSRPPYTGL